MSENNSQQIYESAVAKLSEQLNNSITSEAKNIIDGMEDHFKTEIKRIERERLEKSRAEARKELEKIVEEESKKKSPSAALFESGGLNDILEKGELYRKRVNLAKLYKKKFPKTSKYLSRICKKESSVITIILEYVAENGLTFKAKTDKTPDDTFLRTIKTIYMDMNSEERRGLKKRSNKSNKNKSNKNKSNKNKSNKNKSKKSKQKSKKRSR